MRAIRFYQHGGPEVLRYEHCDMASPWPDQLLIEVEAIGVNPLDWQVRSGLHPLCRPCKLPAVPGTDFAGRVAAIGSAVEGFNVGDRVFGQCDPVVHGSYAEMVPVSSNKLARMSLRIAALHAASLPTTALAAWHAIFEIGELASGQTLLIAGLSGRIGTLAAELSRFVRDVQVVGVCVRERWTDYAGTLCSQLVDPEDDAALSRLQGRFHVVLNLLGINFERQAISSVRPGGRYITATEWRLAQPFANSVRATPLPRRFVRRGLEMVSHLVESGQILHPAVHIAHLSEAALIHRLGESCRLTSTPVLVTG